jgi:hypothetical protein
VLPLPILPQSTTTLLLHRASRLAAEHELSAASEQLRRQRETAREQEIQSLNGELEAVRALVTAAGEAQTEGDEVITILYSIYIYILAITSVSIHVASQLLL